MDQLSHNCFTVTYLGRYLVKYDSYEGADKHDTILFQKTSSLSTVLTNVHECKSQILKQKKEKNLNKHTHSNQPNSHTCT